MTKVITNVFSETGSVKDNFTNLSLWPNLDCQLGFLVNHDQTAKKCK